MLDQLCIQIENPHSFKKTGELFQIGIPFPASLVSDPDALGLFDQSNGEPQFFSCQVRAKWPDKSIKWVLLKFCVDLEVGETKTFGIREGGGTTHSSPSATASSTLASWQSEKLTLPDFIDTNIHPVCDIHSALHLLDNRGCTLTAHISDQSENNQGGSLRCFSLNQVGCFKVDDTDNALDFISKQEWLPEASLLKWQFTLWNKQAAKHPGGCWDLGDPGSIYFDSLELCLDMMKDQPVKWRSDAESDFQEASSNFSLTQSGSACKIADPGHPLYNRNIHKNAKGEVPDAFNGCEIKQGAKFDQLALRASPELFLAPGAELDTSQSGMSISLENFWQNFPKAISVDDSLVRLSLFPKVSEAYELQAGERKTHILYFRLSDKPESLSWVNAPSEHKVLPEWFALCGGISYMPSEGVADSLAPFIEQGIQGAESFIAKRERIDEYGWRHFGDVYADHECLYQKPGEQAYVSHYNNQYDAIYGYARQYLQTGDARWFQLMDELARHVCDIDIYHTEQDRVEYNNGLFWHTDHYLDAHTCTHRTFTRHNQTSSTPGQTGGGPGTEHCYTTGLRLHYLLTGYEPSREAAIKLADWMIATHAGAQSFLAQVLSAKNNELKKLLAVLKGQPVSAYRYPFTRGTGNFMVSLMDAYELTQKPDYLSLLEQVIRESVHPGDDISLRNLEDIELCWSYTVYLQALSRYLTMKESQQQNDEMYAYARASFMRYAQWILENESPYLSKPDVLEFPNDTWVAQEIRKLSLLVTAAQYDKQQKDAFLGKAREFLEYIVSKLEASSEKHFSRIQILLLQSYGPHLYCQPDSPELPVILIQPIKVDFGAAPKAAASKLFLSIIKKVLKGLSYFSPSREQQWIKTRRA